VAWNIVYAGTAPASGDPYTWYSSFNKNDFPPHAAAGTFGSQSTVKEAAAPTGTMTDVTAANATELATHLYTPNRRITLTGSITSGGFNDGNIADVDIILNGQLVADNFFGAGDGSTTINRLRFRGGAVGAFGTGQFHHNYFFGSSAAGSSDLIIEGCNASGPGGNAYAIVTGFNWERVALHNIRAHCGGYFYIGTASDTTITKCSILTGVDTVSQVEAWGIRFSHEALGNLIVYDCDIRSSTNRTNQAYHRIRAHPDPGLDYIWVDSNTLIDRVQTRIFWVDAAAGTGTGDAVATWFTNNTIVAATTDSSTPAIEGGDQARAFITGNAFQSDTFLSDSNIALNGSTATTKSGNTYAGLPGSDPAWGAAGDPTGIDWTP
jgi:hypothetical protein